MNIIYLLYWLVAALPNGYRAEAFNNLIKVTHDGSSKAAYIAPDSTDTGMLNMAILDETDGAKVTTLAQGIRLRFWTPHDPTGEHIAADIVRDI